MHSRRAHDGGRAYSENIEGEPQRAEEDDLEKAVEDDRDLAEKEGAGTFGATKM